MRSTQFLHCIACALLAAAAALASGAGAQTANVASEPATPAPSRWAADLERLDEDVRLRLLTPTDARSQWIRAGLDKTDIASQVTHYAAARAQAPQEALYLASLAVACLQPTRPVLPECDAMDRLADWARRDEDNGIPMILLADRARQRNEADTMVAMLEEAAGKPRFDEYWGRGVLAYWDYLRALTLPYDPAAKAVAALNYATEQSVTWPTAMQAMCANPRQPASDALRTACGRLGTALTQRGASWSARLIGTAVANRNAGDARAQTQIEASRASVTRVRARCDDARRARFDELESADAAVRARELAAGDAWVRAQAQYGEVGACERLVSLATRP
jgi:hypothetical protein